METKTDSSGKKILSRHALIMLLCCIIPLAILAVLWGLGVSQSYLAVGVMLLCPLLHIIMMRGSHKDTGHHH